MDALNKILIATDGSDRAHVAVDLAAAIEWPVDTILEVLEVNEPPFEGTEVRPETIDVLEREVRERIDADLAIARSRLVRRVPMTQTATLRGRPASEIIVEAERVNADLILMGSRGRGPIATMLLGSVAAEVVDQATCPVLIARLPRLRRFLVADDGSGTASLALKAAARWPIFKGLPARVVSVAPVYAMTGVGPVVHAAASQSYAEGVDALRTLHERIAEDGATVLTSAGVPATAELRTGDPAEEIIGAAFESEADLIVMGSRGQSGLERLVLGSVARNVLTQAPMSVLIVRQPR